MQEIASVESYFRLLSTTAGQLPFEAIEEVAATLVQAYESERTIYLFGNGGSAALASHIACDLGKGTVNGSKKRFRVMSLTSNEAMMTAWANDSNYHDIFAEQLANFVAPGDVAFAISCSGNSANVLNALRVARQARATTRGPRWVSGGQNEGALRPVPDCSLRQHADYRRPTSMRGTRRFHRRPAKSLPHLFGRLRLIRLRAGLCPL